MKVPFLIYADLVSLLKKIDTCHNNTKTLSMTKITKHLAPVIHCLHITQLILQKINLIVIEIKIA